MKYITLNDNWRIAIDNNRNHMPERYTRREGGKPTVGGKTTKEFEGWETQGKYFASVQRAVRWVAEEDIDTATLVEYCDRLESKISELMGSVAA